MNSWWKDGYGRHIIDNQEDKNEIYGPHANK